MSDELRRMRHAWTSDRNGLIARAELAESQNQALQERIEEVEGGLWYLLKQVDDVSRTDVLRDSASYRHARQLLSPTQETDPE